MIKTILVGLLASISLAPASLVEAQQPKKIPRLGYISPTSTVSSNSLNRESFLQGLRALGYVEGTNILIEYRNAEGKPERVAKLAEELVRLNMDVLMVGGGTSTVLRVKKVVTSVPVVFALVSDPVGDGVVASLARPGGNLTGLSSASKELVGKRLELLKETIPKLSRVGVLFDPNDPSNIASYKEIEAAAKPMGINLRGLEVRRPDELENAIRLAAKDNVNGVLVMATALLNTQYKRISELAMSNHQPTMFPSSQLMNAGGLMSYGPDYSDLSRRAATYVDKILKGAKPADLPVERPMKFELFINLKTAKQIGVTIPPNVLVRADKVIK